MPLRRRLAVFTAVMIATLMLGVGAVMLNAPARTLDWGGNPPVNELSNALGNPETKSEYEPCPQWNGGIHFFSCFD